LWEIYNNTIFTDKGYYMPFRLRAGTGVVYNNSVTGNWANPNIGLDNVRTFETTAQKCDGTSNFDGNQDSSGYPCRDQIGRGRDKWLWTEKTPYPPQETDPAYEWDNTYSEAKKNVNFVVLNNCQTTIKENRDFFNNTKKLDYRAYPYPHPLRAASIADPISSPKNVRAIN
jgi:hypothetical protein